MDTKNFMIMSIALIVGVILVTGVLTPIIANSIDSNEGEGTGYTNTGSIYFDVPTATTSVTLYPVSATSVSDMDPSLDNPDAQTWDVSRKGVVFGDGWEIQSRNNGTFTCVLFSDYAHPLRPNYLTITGTDTVLHVDGEEDVTLHDTFVYSVPTGDYVSPSSDAHVLPNTVFFAKGEYSDGMMVTAEMFVNGTVSSNAVKGWDVTSNSAISGSVTYGYADDIVSDMTVSFGGSDHVFTSDDTGASLFLIIPITVSSSGGSGVSGSLATILTVIPIIVLAGMVFACFSMFRKN